MYGNSRNNNPKNGKRKKSTSPIRVVIRCSWSGERINVPTEPTPIIGKLSLLEIVQRLESALPSSLFLQSDQESSATLVCLRKLVPQHEWGTTTLKQMLDGDDGSAGVVLTLDMGSTTTNNPVKTAISSAATSLNIKPVVVVPPIAMQIDGRATAPEPPADPAPTAQQPEPMLPQPMDTTPLTDNPHDNDTETKDKIMMPDEAWKHTLQSNFDATTKDCLNTLLKIIDNILSRPNEPKVRSIRCANAAFEKKVGRCKGGFDFLYSIGFTPTYPAIGLGGGGMNQSTAGRQPEMLELTPENESRETLLRGRKVLMDSAVRDLGMDGNDLPSMPKVQESFPVSTLAAPPTAASMGSSDSRLANNNSRGPTSQFNVYKAHSHNIQSAAMGAPDPYAEAGLSTTERQLQNLQSKKDRLEREMQDIQSDRGLVAYVAGSGPVPMEATSSASASGGPGTKSDSSLVAARMKRMEEERKKREEGGFTTKAMRDLEKMKKAKVYSHAQIRVNFPDGSHLHAKFLPREKVSSIRSVIKSAFKSSLAESLDFDLYVAPPRRLLIDTKKLEEEELVPAAKIHVSWKAGASPIGGSYLREELFSGRNTAASAFPEAKPIVKQTTNSTTAAAKGKGNTDGNGSASKEELLMQKMLGKKPGFLGGKNSSNNGKDGAKGKPKWFKG